jgi:threo-3-hydroxy-L-aspartate ammonia-lyase
MTETIQATDAVRFADIESAASTLAGHAHRTPVVTSRALDERVGARLFFKCENLQRAGAFKFRGAYNAMSRLTERQRRQGVLAYSSGNHAQAVALAGRELSVPAAIIMPSDAPQVKIDATRGYGGEVILYDRQTQSREELAAQIASDRGLTLVAPFDNQSIVAGQGTVARELLEDVGTLDYLLVPCGGGGLLSGCSIAAAAMSPGCKAIGVEPAAGDDGVRSFKSGTLESVKNPDTIADGARTSSLGQITFPLIRRYVHDMVTATDDQLIATMALLAERLKLIVEPTGALGAAAALQRIVTIEGKRVGIVLSGGNVELSRLAQWLAY